MSSEDALVQAVLPAIVLGAVAVRAVGIWTLRRAAVRAATGLGLTVVPAPQRFGWLRGVRVIACGTLHLAGRPRVVDLSLEPGSTGALEWRLSIEAHPGAPLCVCIAKAAAGDDASVGVPEVHPCAHTTPADHQALSRVADTYADALRALPEDAIERRLGRGTVRLRQRFSAPGAISPTSVARLAHAAWLLDRASTLPPDADTAS